MELEYKLSRKQKEQLDTFGKRMGARSWCLRRYQGTGLRYWQITWSNEPEFQGDVHDTDGKTLLEAINLVLVRI